MSLRIEKLSKEHKKTSFDCENELLNRYIQQQAKQDVNRDLSACYVLNDVNEKSSWLLHTFRELNSKERIPLRINSKNAPNLYKSSNNFIGQISH